MAVRTGECSFPGCDRAAARTGDVRACRVHVGALRQRARGFISVTRAAQVLKVDRRVLERLYNAGEIAGERWGGKWATIWLERQSLARYLWSRPRCVREDCGRRVLGDGPGCDRHRRDGRRRVSHHCEQCGRETRGRGRLCRSCATRERNRRGGAERLERLQEGRDLTRADEGDLVAIEKACGFFDVTELIKRLPRKHKRSPSAIAGHTRRGLLVPAWPEPGARVSGRVPYLYDDEGLANYVRALEGYDDGRLLRFDTDPRFRASWYLKRHASSAAFGPLTLISERSLEARKRESEVAALWTSELTHVEIGDQLGISARYVRQIAHRLQLPPRRPGRRPLN